MRIAVRILSTMAYLHNSHQMMIARLSVGKYIAALWQATQIIRYNFNFVQKKLRDIIHVKNILFCNIQNRSKTCPVAQRSLENRTHFIWKDYRNIRSNFFLERIQVFIEFSSNISMICIPICVTKGPTEYNLSYITKFAQTMKLHLTFLRRHITKVWRICSNEELFSLFYLLI